MITLCLINNCLRLGRLDYVIFEISYNLLPVKLINYNWGKSNLGNSFNLLFFNNNTLRLGKSAS